VSDRDVVMKLAKVIIAAAWADGEVNNDEVNALKDLLFQLPRTGSYQATQLTGQEWARLEMYIESPVGEAERARLVADLHDALRSDRERELVIQALQNVIEADGVVDEDEKAVVAEIQAAIESAETGALGGLQRLIGGAVQRRSEAVANAPNREAFFDDFIKNKVYFGVSQRLQMDQKEINISDEELRKLSLAGGLMAKVAYVDREVKESEFEGIVSAMQTHWHIGLEAATFVAEVAVSAVDVNYDTFRMMREMATSTSEEERRGFLDILFTVAGADGDVSYDETEEIRIIARGLNMSHKEFIDAKVKDLDARQAAS
jgi:uncharacterized tellurite resistance protein B-like protein